MENNNKPNVWIVSVTASGLKKPAAVPKNKVKSYTNLSSFDNYEKCLEQC